MDCKAIRIPYSQTLAFTRITTDYLDQADALKPFFTHAPTLDGIRNAIEAKKNHKVNRNLLADVLKKQYNELNSDIISKQIESLRSEKTFTITTAHQPNILTGPLYFLYKIAHAIKLASHLKEKFSEHNFVPVYYMGSEDADLEELGHLHIDGVKYEWATKQRGAVGRMKVDREFLQLLDRVEGRIGVLPNGKDIMPKMRNFFREGVLIQDAMFLLVHELFGEEGLIVLLPDEPSLKRELIPVFKDDLLSEKPSELVEATIAEIDRAGYKVQANPRSINLFYLKDDIRNRIEKIGEDFVVVDTDIRFSQSQLLDELEHHPDRFSPNVILRGIFQETILPNIAFIGGGGELAYWLQYRNLFSHYKVPLPVLVLRNSFLIVENETHQAIEKLGLEVSDFFRHEQDILNTIVTRDSENEVRLNGTLQEAATFYEELKKKAEVIDPTLSRHVESLRTQAVKRLVELEKKMLRAEKRKYSDQSRQVQALKSRLFPSGSLQERHENFLYFYGIWGKEFINLIHKNSLALESEFTILIN